MESARVSQLRTCKFLSRLKTLEHLKTSRKQHLEVGSIFCDPSNVGFFRQEARTDSRMFKRKGFEEKIERYSRLDWLKQQSFCYEQQKSTKVSKTLKSDGVCYSFNLDKDLFDKKS